MFAVSLAGPMTRQWWHDVLIFNVYYRPPTDRAVRVSTLCQFDILLYVLVHCTVIVVVAEQVSRVAQWERAGPITQRSMDRNHPLLVFLHRFYTIFDKQNMKCTHGSDIWFFYMAFLIEQMAKYACYARSIAFAQIHYCRLLRQ